jgi:hypothetical protein
MKGRTVRMPAPYLRRVWLDQTRVPNAAAIEGMGASPDFLSHSHGEGFLRFFNERCRRQRIFIFDEPEAALSPSRQIEFLKLLRRMENSGISASDHGDAFADSDGLSCKAAARILCRSGHFH